jgi:hypothetical protein
MIKLTNRTAAMVAVLSLMLLASPSWRPSAQERKLVYENWYGETKKELSAHYTGKTVKLRMAIPNTRRGLEITDGEFQPSDFTQTQAQPGDEMTIKGVKVGANNIELLLNKNGGKRPNRFFGWMKRPRINLRFSRELTAKDMTVENVNRWLAAAIDVTPLTSITAEQSSNHAQPLIASVAETAPKSAPTNNSQDLPTASITGDLTPANPNFGELTVESSTAQARVYIDNAYSGVAPRTVRLRAGAHSILVMANGYAAWEQRLLIPAGKTSLVKVELQR